MSAFEAFVTGFANTTAEEIIKRKDDAREWYKQQMTRAQSIADNKIKERVQTVESMKMTATQLRDQASMPDDVLKGLANEGPEVLEKAYKIYEDAASAGVPVDEDFWRNTVKFATEVKPNSQTLDEFLGTVLQTYPSNVKAVKEEGGSAWDAFISSGLGYNAMDKAKNRLAKTDIGGISAADALKLESAPITSRPLGELGPSFDLEGISQAQQAAKGEGREMTGADVRGWNEFADSLYEEAAKNWKRENNSLVIPPEVQEQLEREVAPTVFQAIGGNAEEFATRMPRWGKYLGAEEGIQKSPLPEAPGAAPTEAVTQEGSPYPEIFTNPSTGVSYKLLEVRPGKGAIYQDEEGNKFKVAEAVPVVQQAEEQVPQQTPVQNREGFDIEVAAKEQGLDKVQLPTGTTAPDRFVANGKEHMFSHIVPEGGRKYAIYYDEDLKEVKIPYE